MIEDEEIHIQFTTLFYRLDLINDQRYPQTFPIYPTQNGMWTYTILSLFLNEIHNYCTKEHSISIKPNGDKTFRFQSDSNPDYYIIVNISNCIIVKISTTQLKEAWLREDQTFLSYCGSRYNAYLKYPRVQRHVRYIYTLPIFLNSSKTLLYKTSLLFIGKYEFSKIFNFFAKKICRFGLTFNDDTEMLFKYFENFLLYDQKKIQSFEDLNSIGMKGYLKLFLTPKVVQSKLPTYIIDENEYYITGGVFIFPQAMSLLYSNDNITINGYILDTTWKVISKYVTSILMASISNSSLPIAFAFGKGENIDLYSKLLNTTSEKLNLNFEGKVLESDQGKSLLSICKTFKMVHLSCLRHFIVSIKKMDYSFEAITLIKCTSQQDLESAMSLFSNKFKKFCTENSGELKKINKVLKKIGLLYINDQIIIQNQSRWDEVSMLQRRLYKMPSTTNTLESTHGQINRKTPRRNTFYSSLFRTFLCLNSKFESINKKLCHDYNYTRIKTLRQKQSLNNEEMINQCLFYQTTKDNCSCGQNKLESELFNIDIPCIHRLFNGASFKDLPQLSLNLEYQFNELLIDHEFVSEDEIQKTSFDDKTYAIRTIKQFSGFKDDKKISEYVNMYYNQEADGFYINNMEVQLIQLIEEGIFYFKQLKESIDIEKVDE